MATPARLAGVGVFVLGGILLFAVGLFMIGDRQMAFAKKFTVYTEFKKITGLQPGAIVRVRGAKAGAIAQILPPNTPSEKFRVKVEITEDLHQLVRTDSLATIETEGLVGGSYLGIAAGTDAATVVAANGTIAGKEPFDIADLMQQMGDTVKKVNDTFDEMKAEVEGTVVAVGDTVDNANKLLVDVTDGHDGALHLGLHFVERVVYFLDGVAHLLHQIGNLERLLAGNRPVRGHGRGGVRSRADP